MECCERVGVDFAGYWGKCHEVDRVTSFSVLYRKRRQPDGVVLVDSEIFEASDGTLNETRQAGRGR